MFRNLLLALVGIALTPSLGMAWDFTCSPRSVTEIEPTYPPNMMLMLDKSGSMAWDGGYHSCKVCERPDGHLFKVDSAAECLPQASGVWTTPVLVSKVDKEPKISGYSHHFKFTGLAAATGTLNLELTVQGDFDDHYDSFEVWVDGVYFQTVDNIDNKCSEVLSIKLSGLPLSAVNDNNEVDIVLKTHGDYAGKDGVDSHACETEQNRATARLYVRGLVYHGTQSWEVCGKASRWEQAYNAIDLMTSESSNQDPDLAAFGLGLFSNSSAKIMHECEQNSHAPIMKLLDDATIAGSTPTAAAIQTSLDSQCILGALAGIGVAEDRQVEPKDGNNKAFQYVHSLSIPPQNNDISVKIELNGDYNNTCEYADIYAYDATKHTYNSMAPTPPPAAYKIGTHTGTSGDECKSSRQNFIIPKAATASGNLVIEVWNSSTSYGTAACIGQNTVSAHCTNNWSEVETEFKTGISRAAATVLITDGEPTVGRDGFDPYPAAVVHACLHRKFANLYVVGQGGGADIEFNHILAAAGGSGSCAGGVDPCDNPKKYDDLRGTCTGAYQTNNSADLLAAIAAITNEIQCVFDVNFSGAPVTDVPLDTTNEYPYLYIQGRFAGLGNDRIYQKSSPLASTPGEGWEFASAHESKRVRLTDQYCNMIQVRQINQVSTQLACLCEEETGTTCTVPDAEFLGLCPEGVWKCDEGTDYCEPDSECCVAGEACTVPGLEGVCAAGMTTCPDPTGAPICEQTVFPSDEICNGLDDDCDGEVDELDGFCTVSGGVGRCAPGFLACSGNDEVCLPRFEPMPELCNGLDDDCDGSTDNITQSWPKFDGTYTLPSADRPKTCDMTNTCVCANGAKDNHAGENFTSFLAEWSNSCMCGEGLEADASYSEQEATPADAPEGDGPQTGCSAVDGGLAPLGLLALFGLARRRRN